MRLETLKPKRTLVVGDIHGGLIALMQILKRSRFNPRFDRLIFIGDYVDSWPDIYELIDFLIDLKKICDFQPIFILGNHDVWMRDYLMYGTINPIWLDNGGQTTLDSYAKHDVDLTEHLKFFTSLHNYFIDEENNLFVHGGFTTEFINQDIEYNYTWDRRLWKRVLSFPKSKVSDNQLDRFNNIFIGHSTTTTNKCKPHLPEYKDPRQPKDVYGILIPMNRYNVWNVDTGGGWEGKLSIMDVKSKEFWQSDLVSELYGE